MKEERMKITWTKETDFGDDGSKEWAELTDEQRAIWGTEENRDAVLCRRLKP